MAFRRRVVRRRAPLRRPRRVIRRRRLRKRRVARRARTGNFTLICRKTFVAAVASNQGYSYQCAPTLNDFEEAKPFIPYFESYRIHSVSVKVTPLFNVAEPNNPVPQYYSAPWHRAGPASLSSNSILSLDKARSHNGTQTTYRSFVPAVLTNIGIAGDATAHIGKVNWRPKIAIQQSSTTIPHYASIYHFSIDQIQGPQATDRQYEFQITSKVSLYTQKGFIG